MPRIRRVMKQNTTRDVGLRLVQRALIGFGLLAITAGASHRNREETILGYARFGFILSAMRGSTNPYVSDGQWRVHPTKQWPEIQYMITEAPCHGDEIRLGYFDERTYNRILGSIRTRFQTIVQRTNAPAWAGVTRLATQNYSNGVDLSGNPYTYARVVNGISQTVIKPYDHDAMRQHWADFKDLVNDIDLTDKATRLQYAYIGMVSSFSRGVTDPFFEGAAKSYKTIAIFQGAPLTRALATNGHEWAEFDNLKKCGNYMCHKFTQLDHSATEENYAFWMLNIQTRLVSMLPRIRANSDSRNKDVVRFWEDVSTRFNAISLFTHGELACFKAYGTPGERAMSPKSPEASRQCLKKMKDLTLDDGKIWDDQWFLGMTEPKQVDSKFSEEATLEHQKKMDELKRAAAKRKSQQSGRSRSPSPPRRSVFTDSSSDSSTSSSSRS